MAWLALARVLFVGAVAYAAALLRPLSVSITSNIAFALGLAALVVLFESRLRETAVTRLAAPPAIERPGPGPVQAQSS